MSMRMLILVMIVRDQRSIAWTPNVLRSQIILSVVVAVTVRRRPIVVCGTRIGSLVGSAERIEVSRVV